MDIFVKGISDLLQEKRDERIQKIRALRQERRRTKADRRHSVNEGVVVSLSSRKDRRNGSERRRAQLDDTVVSEEYNEFGRITGKTGRKITIIA